jgi:hypothetical protein
VRVCFTIHAALLYVSDDSPERHFSGVSENLMPGKAGEKRSIKDYFSFSGFETTFES